MIILVSTVVVVLSIALFVVTKLWVNAKEDLEDEILQRKHLLRLKDREIIDLVRKERAYHNAYDSASHILFHEYGRGLDRVKTY